MDEVLHGVDIIIATPGRLNDLVNCDVIKVESITFLVSVSTWSGIMLKLNILFLRIIRICYIVEC